MASSERQINVPPYQLCSLIPKVQPFSDLEGSFQGGRTAPQNRITCAQALGMYTLRSCERHCWVKLGRNIYIGCSDGVLLRYSLEEAGNVGLQSLSITLVLSCLALSGWNIQSSTAPKYPRKSSNWQHSTSSYYIKSISLVQFVTPRVSRT